MTGQSSLAIEATDLVKSGVVGAGVGLYVGGLEGGEPGWGVGQVVRGLGQVWADLAEL